MEHEVWERFEELNEKLDLILDKLGIEEEVPEEEQEQESLIDEDTGEVIEQ